MSISLLFEFSRRRPITYTDKGPDFMLYTADSLVYVGTSRRAVALNQSFCLCDAEENYKLQIPDLKCHIQGNCAGLCRKP